MVLAAKKSLDFKDDEKRRVRFKIRLIRELLRRGYTREEVIGEKAMPYVTSWARIAMQKGMEQGIQLGMLQQGRLEFLLDVLEERFGLVSSDVAEKVKDIDDMDALKDLFRKAIQCGSLEEFLETLTR